VAPAEVTLFRSLPWLAAGLAAALVVRILRGRLVSAPRITIFTVHLSAMLALVLTAALALVPLTSSKWFQNSGLPEVGRLMASGASLTILLAAGIAAVSIASSAALGYRPSLSYLQLLASADAGMATAGTSVGLAWAFGPAVATLGGASVAAVCVWSIWRYLDVVGFEANGGWKVDKQALWRYVYPYDVAALMLVASAIVIGALLRST
jgi:hypothetical protein